MKTGALDSAVKQVCYGANVINSIKAKVVNATTERNITAAPILDILAQIKSERTIQKAKRKKNTELNMINETVPTMEQLHDNRH